MSTVKQTQAIPYTGPFNLLYYQLQKLTGVFTEIHIIAFLVRIFKKMYCAVIIVSEFLCTAWSFYRIKVNILKTTHKL